MSALVQGVRWLVLCLAGAIMVLSPTQAGIRLKILDPVRLSVVDPLIWLACGAWVLLAVREGRWKWIPLPPAAAWLFAIPAVASLAGGGHYRAGLGDLFQWVEYFIVLYILFCGLVDDVRRVKMFAGLFSLVAIGVVGVALTQYGDLSTAVLGVRGTFGNRNVLGGYLALALPFMAGVAICSPDWRLRAGLAVAVVAGLAVNLSGGSLLGLAVALPGMAGLRSPRALLGMAVVLLGGAAVLSPILPRSNVSVAIQSIQLFDEESDVVQADRRYTEWQAAVKMTAEHPWRGVGMGRYQASIGQYYGTLPDPTGPTEPDTQNLYLVVASSVGLPGLICLAGLLMGSMGLARRAYGRLVDGSCKGVAMGIFGALLAYSINALWSPLLVRGVGVQLAVLVAVAGALARLPGGEPGARLPAGIGESDGEGERAVS